MVLAGIDNRDETIRALKGLRIGLITNHTGLNVAHRPSASVLMQEYRLDLVRLFGPEHGIWGDVADLDAVDNSTDPVTGLPVISLFGPVLEPPEGSLDGLDALVFDIQDIGSRYYTFLWTMAKSMVAAAKAGKKFVVLDRPNPITGEHVEGNVLDARFSSFVGLHPCATRHGMTAGEMALYLNGELGFLTDLTVVPVVSWRRSMWFDETGLTFVPPSPNTTGLPMATVYPGTCLFEGTNFSEGRGTTQPFEVVGAPFVDPFAFAAELNALRLPGVWFRPVYFIPWASKYQGTRCGGVQVHVSDRQELQAWHTGLSMLRVAKRIKGFEWKNDPATYSIDWLAGTDQLRLQIDAGATVDELMGLWSGQLADFCHARQKYLIYA